MWPAILPARIRTDRYRRAEVKVYDQLEKSLGPGWTVFYSRPWLGLTPTGGERDGEADFIIVHPQHGFLALEVKGGGISHNPATDAWQSTDSQGIRHTIKNPFAQARRAKHELLEKLKEGRDWPRNRFVRARHAVIFPDAENPPGNLGADMPRELICCRPGLNRLAEWVLQRLSSGPEEPLGRDGVQAFENLLAKPFTLRVPLGHVLEEDDHTIGLLTPEQFYILDAVSINNRMAAGGAAGAGKTVMAIEDALRLSEKGLRTLLTCMSVPLANMLRQRLSGRDIAVLSLDELCREACRTAALPEFSLTEEEGPERLLDIAIAHPTFRFDAIVVDEAQDFRSYWWIALDALLVDPASGYLHAFYDSNQSLYGSLAKELAGFALLPIHLSRNLRNTRSIHTVASHFYQGLPVRADGPEGVPVRWLECDQSAIAHQLARAVLHLINHESVRPSDIAVLAPSEPLLAQVARELGSRAIQVTLETIARFKGLERSVVALAATSEIADQRELAYVGLSRARTHLIVAGEAPILGWLQCEPTLGAAELSPARTHT
jgi:hypothetical protein